MDQREWDELYASRELVWTAEANRFVTGELAGLTAGRALDLGTGEGRNAIWLAERGWQVTAVDFSAVGLAKAAELAARRGATGIRWVEADLREYQPGQAAPGMTLEPRLVSDRFFLVGSVAGANGSQSSAMREDCRYASPHMMAVTQAA